MILLAMVLDSLIWLSEFVSEKYAKIGVSYVIVCPNRLQAYTGILAEPSGGPSE